VLVNIRIQSRLSGKMVKDPIVQLTLTRDTPVLYRELISSCVETRFWWALSSAFNFLGTLLNRIEKRCFTSRRFIACVYGTTCETYRVLSCGKGGRKVHDKPAGYSSDIGCR